MMELRMMSHRSAPVGVLLLVAFAAATSGFKSSGGIRAQERHERTSASERARGGDGIRLSDPTESASGAGFKGVDPASFDEAARKNVRLQHELEWNFGGKGQRGWGLYTPLISDLIRSGMDVAAREFAKRVAHWQRENGVEPTGVLDGETWYQMVSRFQSRRIPGRPYVAPKELVAIPMSDCYDPTREQQLRNVERETFAAYKRMCAAAAADRSLGLQAGRDGQLTSSEKFLKIISAFRSREHQDQLRRQSPNSGRAGLAINSSHLTGRALDLYVGGEPVSTNNENRALQTRGAVYRWLVKNAARFGFQPYFYEPWHWEYVGLRIAGGGSRTERRGKVRTPVPRRLSP
jgi:hypothetical protein